MQRAKPTPSAPPVKVTGEKPRRLGPKMDWERLYFDIVPTPPGYPSQQSIDGRVKLSKLPNLRDYVLPPGDIEVRVWDWYAVAYLQGFVFRRAAGRWTAVRLVSAFGDARGDYKKMLPVPRSGWESWWKRLVSEGLLSLPDDSTLKDDLPPRTVFLHGASYIVEINQNKTYRTYKYYGPKSHKWPEAQHILAIMELLYQEFGLQ